MTEHQTVRSFVCYIAHESNNRVPEIAQNFKEQGNDYFKGKRHREALAFYSQGIDAKPTNPAVLEALLCNRAACNLELSEAILHHTCLSLR